MRTSARLAAIAVTSVLTLGGTLVAVSPAQAFTPQPSVDGNGVYSASAWLQKQVPNGVVHNRQYDYDDYGLSIDIALALDAVDEGSATVTKIRDTLAAHVGDYVSGPTAAAKAGVLADTVGGNTAAASFGGQDLVSQVSNAISTSSGTEGRLIGNSVEANDYASTITQSYAVNVLTRATDSKAASATSFLLKQQCPQGGFRQGFAARSASDQTCTDNTQQNTDATAIAILQLQSSGNSSTEVASAITDAKAYLLGTQADDGSWGGGTGTSDSNANSTGLAAWALGDTTPTTRAAKWLRSHQATWYDRCDKLFPSIGAIAYDTPGLANGRADGITVQSEDQFRRATAQALPGLMYLDQDNPAPAPKLAGPSGYQKAGATVVLTTSGVHSGNQLCLVGPSASVQGTSIGTTWTQSVRLPAGTATRTYIVRDRDGVAGTAAVKVLGVKTLGVHLSTTSVKRNRSVTATVSGLAPNELAYVYRAGTRVASGRANSHGVYTATFSSGGTTGKRTITGYGRFTDIRHGSTTLKVVR